jgi:hypothetical protein
MRAAPSLGSFAVVFGVLGAFALPLGACRTPEQPPLSPPTPINPTVEAANDPDDLDASVVTDAAPQLDVGSIGPDASPLRAPRAIRSR